MTDQWHAPLRHIRGAELTGQTNQTTGMTRREAISGKTVGSQRIWMGQTHVAPSTNSGDHHHGEAETAIYVVSGNPVFVFAEGSREVRIEAAPGDYVFVPPYTPHREENPGAVEAVVVIGRSSQEGVVVNLPSLWAEVEIGAGVEVGAEASGDGTDECGTPGPATGDGNANGVGT